MKGLLLCMSSFCITATARPPDMESIRDIINMSLTSRDKGLEVGCGDGTKSQWIAPLFSTYTAIDRNPVMITSATQKRGKGVKIEYATHTLSNLAESDFNAIIFINSFHFLNFNQTFKDVAEKLSHTGICIVVEPRLPQESWKESIDPWTLQKKTRWIHAVGKFLTKYNFTRVQTDSSDVYISTSLR